MSDLLTRLAQRALGVAPAVEPLLRPRYAADLPGPSAPGAEPDEVAGWPSAAAVPATPDASDALDAHPAAEHFSPPAYASSSAPAAGDAARRDASPPALAPEIRAAASSPPVETADDGLLLPPASAGSDPSTLLLEPRSASAASAGRGLGDEAPDPVDAAHPHAPERSIRPARGASPSPLHEPSSTSAPPLADAAGTHPTRRDPVIRPPQSVADEHASEEDDDLLLPLLPVPERVFAGRTERDAGRRSAGRTGAPPPLAPSAAEADGEARAEAGDADEPASFAADRDPRPLRSPAPSVRLDVDGGSAGAEGPARAAGGEEARPVVRVSIGRVEVRGAPPADPAPARTRPAWTPPVLSLDDYLKRGAGR